MRQVKKLNRSIPKDVYSYPFLFEKAQESSPQPGYSLPSAFSMLQNDDLLKEMQTLFKAGPGKNVKQKG